MTKAPSRQLLARWTYRNDFPAFARFAARLVHDQPIQNWHFDVMADAIATASVGEVNCLSICTPPKHGKTFLAVIAFTAFMIAKNPEIAISVVLQDAALIKGVQGKVMDLLRHSRYRAINPHVEAKMVRSQIRTAQGGTISFDEALQAIRGTGPDIIIIDDPISAAGEFDFETRTTIREWVEREVLGRMDAGSTKAVIHLAPRHGFNDLTAFLGYGTRRRMMLMKSIAAEDEVWHLSSGDVLRRTKGEALCAALLDKQQLLATLNRLGGCAFSRLFQHMPYRVEREEAHFLLEPYEAAAWTPLGPQPKLCAGTWSMLEELRFTLFGIGRAFLPRWDAEKFMKLHWEPLTILHADRLLERVPAHLQPSVPPHSATEKEYGY